MAEKQRPAGGLGQGKQAPRCLTGRGLTAGSGAVARWKRGVWQATSYFILTPLAGMVSGSQSEWLGLTQIQSDVYVAGRTETKGSSVIGSIKQNYVVLLVTQNKAM